MKKISKKYPDNPALGKDMALLMNIDANLDKIEKRANAGIQRLRVPEGIDWEKAKETMKNYDGCEFRKTNTIHDRILEAYAEIHQQIIDYGLEDMKYVIESEIAEGELKLVVRFL